MHLHFITEAVNDLFQWLDFLGTFYILCDKSAGGQFHDIENSMCDHIHFVIGRAGEDNILFILFLGVLGDISGMVCNPLKIR